MFTFFNYFSFRGLLSKKKITVLSCAVDRFNNATDRRFGYTPMLNHDHKSLFKIRSTYRKFPPQIELEALLGFSSTTRMGS